MKSTVKKCVIFVKLYTRVNITFKTIFFSKKKKSILLDITVMYPTYCLRKQNNKNKLYQMNNTQDKFDRRC